MRLKSLLLVAGLMLAGLPGVASAALTFTNGSFEVGTDPGSYATLAANDNSSINGWTVGPSGTVDYIGTYWQAAQGTRSIDLDGISQGSISQTFSVDPNTTYTVSFQYAGNPDVLGAKSGAVLATVALAGTPGGISPVTFTNTGATTRGNMGWLTSTFTFISGAGNTSATLSFSSLTAGAYGLAIDNVQVSGPNAVPEPASMAIWGIGALGCAVAGYRRRKLA